MHPEFTPEFVARFWAKVDKSSSPHGCWLWTAATKAGNYGSVGLPGRRNGSAHRVSYELAFGPIPDGIEVCHSCDRFYAKGDVTYRRCVRNDGANSHLWPGTHLENVRDMYAKGRQLTLDQYARGDRCGPGLYPERYGGERNGHAKLTEDMVRELRRIYAAGGITYKALGKHYGITGTHVRYVVDRLNWKDVT